MTDDTRSAVILWVAKLIDYGKGVSFPDIQDDTTLGELADRLIAIVEKGREETTGVSTTSLYSGIVEEAETIEEEIGFREALQNLINKYSLEGTSKTPDFILASFLENVLMDWNHALVARDKWYAFDPLRESR